MAFVWKMFGEPMMAQNHKPQRLGSCMHCTKADASKASIPMNNVNSFSSICQCGEGSSIYLRLSVFIFHKIVETLQKVLYHFP